MWREVLYHFLGVVAAILCGLGLIGLVIMFHEILVVIFR